MLALAAKIFRYRSGRQRGANPQQWRLVRSGYDEDGSSQPLFTQRVLEEIANLAAAFSHQRQHGQFRGCAARHHAEERAFAHAAAPENSDALPPSACKEAID